jgi:S1-C subfamily serine protease
MPTIETATARRQFIAIARLSRPSVRSGIHRARAAAHPASRSIRPALLQALDRRFLFVELREKAIVILRSLRHRLHVLANTILLGGDLIVAIDGQEVNDLQDISRVLNNRRAGETVTVTVYRGKRKADVRVTLGEARQA